MFLVGRGKIAGSFCDSFWRIDASGYHIVTGAPVTETERELIRADIARHRASLMRELNDLENVERVLGLK
jgi:hypothetical protein